jgi:DNA-binding transcriptional ArsR family regulator
MDENGERWSALPAILDGTPQELHDRVLDILDRWHREVFAPDEERSRVVIERDVRAKRAVQDKMTRDAFVEFATNGLEVRVERWMRRIVLAPHLSMRPWNVMAADDDALVICYAVADQSLDADTDAPPARLVRLHKALGDERRLRLLKILARGPAGLPELSEAVGLAKSTTHHHMVVLRSAGLITTSTEPDVRYNLRADRVPEMGAELSAFLGGIEP